MRTGLPLLDVEGGPRDVGRQHGRGARAAVAHNVRLYLERFESEAGIDRAEIRRRSQAYLAVIEKANPAYGEEMAGIAEGSGQDLLDVVAVNVRYEILYTEFARKGLERAAAGAPRVGGCTAFAVLPERTSDGHLLLGQNWDWIPEVRGLVVRARRDGLPESLGFTEAGIAGAKIGVNAAGIGLAINGLVTDKDSWSRLRTPFHVRCWEVLAATRLEDAVRAVAGTKRACSANFVVASAGARGAEVVDIETAPDAEFRVGPEGGLLAHANHFTHPGSAGITQPLAGDRPSTFHRHARMQALLREAAGGGRRVRLEDLKGILRDHDGRPDSICRHVNESRPPNERYETVASAILDVDAREMSIAAGPPCGTRYRRVALRPRPPKP